jgi:transcriptional regulator with XRE-family HTH domain
MTKKLRLEMLAAKRRKKLSYQELGRAVGCSRQWVWALLSGKSAQSPPPYKTGLVDALKKVLL